MTEEDAKVTLEYVSEYRTNNDKYTLKALDAIKIVLNLIRKKEKEIEILETNNEILEGELERIGIDTLKLEKGSSTDDVIEEIKKKDKIIEEMSIFIANLDIDEDICKHQVEQFCKKGTYEVQVDDCVRCIKEYFEKKVNIRLAYG